MNKMSYADYNAMSTEDLRAMNHTIYSILQGRSQEKIEDIKDQIRIGSKVKVNHHRTRYSTFTVTEIKRKKAIVRDEYGKSFNVPIDLIELAK
jgi:hypothetical protein